MRLTVVMVPTAIYELLHGLRASPTPLRRLPARRWHLVLEHLGHAPTMAREPRGHRRGTPEIARDATQAGVVGAKVVHRAYPRYIPACSRWCWRAKPRLRRTKKTASLARKVAFNRSM